MPHRVTNIYFSLILKLLKDIECDPKEYSLRTPVKKISRCQFLGTINAIMQIMFSYTKITINPIFIKYNYSKITKAGTQHKRRD